MVYQYKVVPFIGHTKSTFASEEIAKQLETAISQHVSQGWELYQLADVNIEVQPGCLAGLFGAKVQYGRFDQLIFRRDEVGAMVSSSEGVAVSIRRESVEVPPLASRQQPVVNARSKLKCWKCGTANDRRQINCSSCDSKLYEPPS